MNIHLVQMSHTDLGYTDSRERIREAYADFLCQALDLVEAYRDYPDGSRFRWTVETSWALRQFVERRPGRVTELVEAVREKSIELTANYMHFTDLIDPGLLEESTHWLQAFLDEHELSVRVATHNDINGFPSALPSVLRDTGVEFLATGMNHTMALGLGHRHSLAHWTALDGTMLPVWYGDHYNQGNWMGLSPRNTDEIFGRPTWPYEGKRDRADDLYLEAVENTRHFLSQLRERSYPWNCVLIQCAGLQADNSPPDAVMCDIARRFNEEQPLGSEVQLSVSSLEDFFTDLMKEAPQQPEAVETWQGAWPDYWAFGLGASPEEVKAIRQAQAILPAARALHTPGNPDEVEAVEEAMLALEHTFGAYDSVLQWHGANARQQWCLKQETFYRTLQLCEGMIERAELAAVRHHPLKESEILLLNSLSLSGRTFRGIVQLPASLTDGHQSLELAFESGSVPLQILSHYDFNFGRHCHGGHWLFHTASDGARESRVRLSSDETITTGSSRSSGTVLENDWLRLELDPERLGLSAIRNQQTGRDYLHAGMTPLGAMTHERHPQLLRPPGSTDHDNESKGVAPTTSSLSPEAEVCCFTARRVGKPQLVRGPLFDEMTISGELESYASLQLTIRLHHLDGCLELIYGGVKEWLNKSNADHVHFGANFQSPRFLLETSGGLFEPGKQQVAGSCLDFFTVQHCAVIHNDSEALVVDPVDAPLMQIGQPTLGAWLRELEQPAPYLVSNLYNNLWFTNFLTAHVGPLSSRYVLRFGAASEIKSLRQSTRDCAHPPLIGYAGEKRMPLPPLIG